MEVGSMPATATRRISTTHVALAGILVVALWLRVFGFTMHSFDWGDGTFVHPDEMFVGYSLVGNLHFPSSPLDFFNPDSRWNPAVADASWRAPVNGHPAHDSAGFNYGSLPLYLIKIFISLLSWLAAHVPGFGSWQNANPILAGRVLSGIFDTITVFLVFLLGKRLADERTGLFAAVLATFAVLSVQLAHFTTVDSFLATFATGTVLASVILFEEGRRRDYAIAGIWLAAALATKASAAPLVATVAIAVLWRLVRYDRGLKWRGVASIAVLGAVTLAALFLFQPYTFLDWSNFRAGVQYQSDLASGAQIVFYTIKWHGTAPLVYPLIQLTNYSLGIPLALLAFDGVLYEVIRSLTPRRHAGALVAFFVLSYFVSAGLLYMKYLRYMEPIVPSLCVLAALFVAAMVKNRLWIIRRFVRGAGFAVGGVVLLLTVCYGLAYQHIYSQPLTRVQASCWIYHHVPSGARLFGDSPDEQLPLACGNGRSYQSLVAGNLWFADYNDDSLAKVQMLSQPLSQAQYYCITSRRASETFDNYGSKYPYMQRFYALLLGSTLGIQDALGYTLVAQFVEHPRLGPWTFTEQGANQNFTEYDHPPVLIFKNTGHLSAAAIVAVMTNHGRIVDPTTIVQRPATPPKSLLLSAREIAGNQQTPTYRAMFPPDSLPMRLPILAWLLMVELVGLLALPISMRLFGRLSDCGFALAKTCGILVLSWFAWILPSLHLAAYSRGEIALCLLPVAALSLAWGVRLHDISRILRSRWVAVALTEGLFLAGFLLFVWLRMLYPDLGHSFDPGEKTMDVSFLNAIVRSRVMPPYDPWYSGGYLNYYYYGHFVVATLLKLVGITPTIAINLAMPTWFGLSLATCVVVAHTLVKRIPFALLAGGLCMFAGNLYGAQVLVGDLQAASPMQHQLSPPTSAGSQFPILGGILNLVSSIWSQFSGLVQGTIATLLGTGQVLLHHASLPWYPFRTWAWGGSRAIDGTVITEFPYWTFLYGDPHAHLWDMPFMLCIVAAALNLMLGGSTTDGERRWEHSEVVSEADRSRPLLPGLRFAVWPIFGVLLGAIGPTNPWDLAAMFCVIGLVTVVRSFWLRNGWAKTAGLLLVRLGVLAICAFGFYAPFYTHFQSFYSHIGWTLLRHQSSLHDFATHFGLPLYVLVAYLGYSAWTDTYTAWRLRDRSRVLQFTLYYWKRRHQLPRYFAMVRPQLSPGAAWRPYREHRREAAIIILLGTIAAAIAAALSIWLLAGLLLAITACLIAVGTVRTILYMGGGLALLFLAIDYQVLALLVAMASLTLLLLLDRRQRQGPALLFLHVLILMGLAVAAAGEIVYVRDFNDGDPILFRNNTVFKLYEDAWLFLNIGAAVVLARLLLPFLNRRGRRGDLVGGMPATEPFGEAPAPDRWRRDRAPRRPGSIGWIWLGGLALLIVAVAIYPIRMTPERLDQRATAWPALAMAHIGPTLDGMAFLKVVYPDDYAAIQWIDDTIPGSPVVLQSHHGFFTDMSARITMYTGLPSVLNWDFEEGQQRYSGQDAGNGRAYPDQIGVRARDVDTIYSTTDIALALRLLRHYHVSYICVGVEERGDPYLAGDKYAFHGYPAAGLAKFPRMVQGHELVLVFSHGAMRIYRVL